MKICLNCGHSLQRSYKYCSNRCQQDYQYKEYIKKWKLGLVSGERGVNAKNISQYLKRYLLDKYGERCSICNWAVRHSLTGRVPLEIDHIDGDSENNLELNVRLICPNCHSLSPNFRNLNKGNGRAWRVKKYIKVSS